MIRVAATADVHLGRDSAGRLRPHLEDIDRHADVLLIAGDLTTCGHPDEARVLAAELADLPVPAIAVLGNHDHHSGAEDELRAIVEDAGVTVLEGESAVVGVEGGRLGVAGAKGFGGGFAGACAADFGEAERSASCGTPTPASPRSTTRRSRRRCGASGRRSSPSSAATSSRRRSTAPAPTWCSTATRTRAPSTG